MKIKSKLGAHRFLYEYFGSWYLTVENSTKLRLCFMFYFGGAFIFSVAIFSEE